LKTVDLVEWQTLGPSETDFLKGINLSFDKKAQRIADELASSDRIEVLQLQSGIQIRTTSWVERIVLGDLTITVHPKINGAPLLNLLRYAYSLRDLQTFTPTSFDRSTEAFQDLIVEQLANEAAELLSRGLHRDYLRFSEQLASPAGRINFGQVAHTLATAKPTIACTYYNRSEAVLLNRVLLAGLRLAAWVSTDTRLSDRVFRLAQILEVSVPAMRLTKADMDDASRVIDRRTTACGSALTLIDLLLSGMGISMTEAADPVQMPGISLRYEPFFSVADFTASA
jgi:5-methylcytosine-specific restriction enzyme subunit McrC